MLSSPRGDLWLSVEAAAEAQRTTGWASRGNPAELQAPAARRQFSVATVTTRGYAFLTPGIKARQTSEYFFAGNPLGANYHSTLAGPFDGIYDFTDDVGFSSLVWSPCGGSAIFAINTMLNLNALGNKLGDAIISTDTVDGSFRKVVHWEWQPC